MWSVTRSIYDIRQEGQIWCENHATNQSPQGIKRITGDLQSGLRGDRFIKKGKQFIKSREPQ